MFEPNLCISGIGRHLCTYNLCKLCTLEIKYSLWFWRTCILGNDPDKWTTVGLKCENCHFL